MSFRSLALVNFVFASIFFDMAGLLLYGALDLDFLVWRSGYELFVLTLVAVVTLGYIRTFFISYSSRKAV